MSKKSFTIYDNDLKVIVEETAEKKGRIFNRILQFCENTSCISGESFHQCDDPQEKVYSLMDDIFEIMEFEEEWQ